MNERELNESIEDQFGALPHPEILEICHDTANQIKTYVIESSDWFRYQNIDWIRIRIQSMVLDAVSDAIHLDRQSGPDFFGTVRREQRPLPLDPPTRRKPPPLWPQLYAIRARRNGNRA